MIFLYYWQHICLLQKMNYGGVNMVVQIPLRANQDPGRCSRGLLGCVGVCAGKKRRFIATSHETPRSPRAVKEIDHIANRYFLLNFNQVFRLKYFPHCSWAQKNDISFLSWLRTLQLTISLDNKIDWCSFRYLTASLKLDNITDVTLASEDDNQR